MTQALYNKWRPQKWDEIVGQQHVVQTLRNAVVGNRVVHAYLFAGPRGTGKTTAARLLAKAVNCLNEDPAARPCNECAHCVAVNENRFLDLIEIDAASNTSVEDVRDLRDKINFSPNQGTYKVYIIDEVHMLSTAAFNALLKTLEEPPAHAIFILATTEMHKIPATVLSRCQRHEFRRLPVDSIVGQLQNIVTNEKLTAEPEALTLIARQSAGGMRDAISLLDQMASTGQEITLGLTQTVLGTATSQTVIDLVGAVLNHDPAAGMDAIHTALDAGTDPRLLARQVVDYLRALLLIQMGNASQVDLASEYARPGRETMPGLFPRRMSCGMIKAFNNAAVDLRGGWQPSLPLELALAEVMGQPAPTVQSGTQPGAKPPGETQVVKPAARVSNEVQPPPKESWQCLLFIRWRKLKSPGMIPTRSHLIRSPKPGNRSARSLHPQSPSLVALLNSCKPLEIKNGVLVIGFANDLVRSKMDTTEQLEITRKAIAKVCGGDFSIKCVVSNAKQAPPANVKADGMVAAALKKGGEIVDIQE